MRALLSTKVAATEGGAAYGNCLEGRFLSCCHCCGQREMVVDLPRIAGSAAAAIVTRSTSVGYQVFPWLVVS